ncbi:MAG: hypothetical protein HY736_24615 [Verrucomicrobia bacterium]|nr:hypothetical protein [Verrucomicrobiota bacterium]
MIKYSLNRIYAIEPRSRSESRRLFGDRCRSLLAGDFPSAIASNPPEADKALPVLRRVAPTSESVRLSLTVFAIACGIGTPLLPAAERVLFAFDDHSIPWQHNLKLTLVPATKHPDNPVLRRGPEGAPDNGHAALYGTVIKEGGTFRMWYLGMFEKEIVKGQAPGMWRPMCYAESSDGVHWRKPELGLVKFNGGKKNNICLIEGEPFSLTRVNDFLSILHDPDDPDRSRRYKAAFIAHVPYDEVRGGMSNIGVKEKRICATITATSADGLKWKVVGDRPANARGERFEVSGLYRFGDFYYTPGQLIAPWAWRPDGSDGGRVMLTYRSADFVHWSQAKAFAFARPGQLTNPRVTGQQTHMGAGLWNRGNVMVGLYGMWQDAATPPPKGASHNLGVRIDLGLVVSNDGIHFREPVANFKVIPLGGEGEWDDIALLQGHAFVNEGDQTMMWYSHWDTGGKLKSMEVGLATLRRDGFGHLSPKEDDNDAHFVTMLVTAGRRAKLRLNVDGVSAETPLRVELLDNRDRPLPGYAGTAAARVATNGTGVDVVWPGARGGVLPVGQPFAVKVTFPAGSTARVFTVYVID